jgi:hypothetical protein
MLCCSASIWRQLLHLFRKTMLPAMEMGVFWQNLFFKEFFNSNSYALFISWG